jgi:C-terminal processing protease CtpA/Prc
MIPAKQNLGQQSAQISTRDREYAQLILSDVRETLKKNYYDPSFHGVDVDQRYKIYAEQIKDAKTTQTAYRAIEAYLVGLDDSHTIFIPPPNSKHVAYGFQLQMIGDQCFITDVRPGSDAAQKLHPGDQVLSLDGFTLTRRDLWQLEYYLYLLPPRLTTDFMVRGVTGVTRRESVTADLHEGRLIIDLSVGNMKIAREKFQHALRSRSSESGGVLIWKFPSFNSDEGAISNMVSEARKHKALVLDLRGNPGGIEDTLLFLLGHIFDHDVTVGHQVTRKEQKPLMAKSAGHDAFTGPLTVLVDSRSSSAAEIFARVVQIEGRGSVIGDRSAGSVMAARYFPLKVGVGLVVPSGIEITVADLLMQDGRSLEKLGVIPDLEILPTPADLANGRDPVLASAVEMSGGKLDADAAGKMFPYEWPPIDPTAN